MAYIKDINTNGGYYRGKFGFDQYYYYRIFNLYLECETIMMSVETVRLFTNTTDFKNLVTKQGEMSLERKTEQYKELDNFINDEERVTVKEWNELNHYINAMEKMFWKS